MKSNRLDTKTILIYSVSLLLILLIGLLSASFPTYILAGMLIFSACMGWVWWSKRHLLDAFVITLFIVVLVSSRLEVRILSLGGAADRGFISLADPLWLGLIISFLLRKTKIRFPWSALGVLPYITFAIVLPIIGIIGEFPFSYMTPAMRIFQWASFGYMTYIIGKEYGIQIVFRRISSVMLWASIIHFLYASIQYMASTGFISRTFLWLDQVYAVSHETSWFYFPRLTGLFVNPNSYGNFCSLAALFAIALLVVRPSWASSTFLSISLITSIAGILMSGSRSGILAFFVGSLVIFFIALQRVSKFLSLVKIVSILCFIAIISFVLLPVVPYGEIIFTRFERILSIIEKGIIVESNALIRVEMWKEACNIYTTYYPFGTGVPPSYAFGMAIDSYYVVTLTQGGPLFTLAFLIMLATVAGAGYTCWRLSQPTLQALGLTTLGFTSSMAVGSLFCSPPLQSFLIISFWSLTGLVFIGKRCICNQ